MTSPKKPSGRTARRALARDHAKLARDLDRLARLEPGGNPGSPVELSSASLVEPRAQSTPCPLCGGKLRVIEHVAETFQGARLRVARMKCQQCGDERALYYRLGSALPN